MSLCFKDVTTSTLILPHLTVGRLLSLHHSLTNIYIMAAVTTSEDISGKYVVETSAKFKPYLKALNEKL